MIEFQTKYHQAFVATIEYLAIIKEVTPAGYSYICPDDDRVRLNFPEECVSQATQMAFKVPPLAPFRFLFAALSRSIYFFLAWFALFHIAFTQNTTS